MVPGIDSVGLMDDVSCSLGAFRRGRHGLATMGAMLLVITGVQTKLRSSLSRGLEAVERCSRASAFLQTRFSLPLTPHIYFNVHVHPPCQN